MAGYLEELLDKLVIIRDETKTQIGFLSLDTSRVNMSLLVDLTSDLEEIMLNPALSAPKNYSQLIANFLAENPLTIVALTELIKLVDEFDEFLRS